jgi:hypothetical protein
MNRKSILLGWVIAFAVTLLSFGAFVGLNAQTYSFPDTVSYLTVTISDRDIMGLPWEDGITFKLYGLKSAFSGQGREYKVSRSLWDNPTTLTATASNSGGESERSAASVVSFFEITNPPPVTVSGFPAVWDSTFLYKGTRAGDGVVMQSRYAWIYGVPVQMWGSTPASTLTYVVKMDKAGSVRARVMARTPYGNPSSMALAVNSPEVRKTISGMVLTEHEFGPFPVVSGDNIVQVRAYNGEAFGFSQIEWVMDGVILTPPNAPVLIIR